MFYVIATVLVILALFFLYSAISAFNELRKGIKKKVQAKPYMVALFLLIALILFVLAYLAIVYQATWNQHWDEFWIDRPLLLSNETKLAIYNVVQEVEPITMYGAFGFGALFTISLLTFRRLSAHLFIGTIALAIITFICFIVIQYTEPNRISQSNEHSTITSSMDKQEEDLEQLENKLSDISEVDAITRNSITRYLSDENTNVLLLSQFLREHFRIPRNMIDANVDQLKQYVRGLTEIKQKLAHVEVPKGAEDVAALIKEWLQQEINIATDCLAEKRETGIFGIMVKFNNVMADLIFDRNKEHHKTTDRVRSLRAEFIKNPQAGEDLKLDTYFSFIK